LIEVGELARADSMLEQTIAAAEAAGDERVEWRARLERAAAQVRMGGSQREAAAVAEDTAAALARIGDDLGLARAWNLVALTHFWLGDTAAAEGAWRSARAYARRAGSPREEAEALSWLLVSGWFGPTPVDEAILRCREALAGSPTRQVEAIALTELAALLATRGEFAEARKLFRDGKEILRDLGFTLSAAGVSLECFDIEMLAGDPAAAEAELREACTVLEQLGEKGFLSTRAACLAHALCAQGRYQEAEPFVELSADSGADDDWATQALWRSACAKVRARQGDFERAMRLAADAVEVVAATDLLSLRADTMMDLAEVLELAGKTSDATGQLEHALALYERKGNVVMADRARARLEHAVLPS